MTDATPPADEEIGRWFDDDHWSVLDHYCLRPSPSGELERVDSYMPFEPRFLQGEAEEAFFGIIDELVRLRGSLAAVTERVAEVEAATA